MMYRIPLRLHPKLLELNEFSNVTGYKINTYKSIVFFLSILCTNNELPEREMKKTIPGTMASKRIKYLRINLTKEAKTSEEIFGRY